MHLSVPATMENKEPRVSEGSVHSPSLSCSRALESDAECFQVTVSGQSDSTTGVSLTNSIEWHDQAYRQLLLVKEVYNEEYRIAHQCAIELQTCNAEESAVHENSINNFERMSAFLSMPKSRLSHYSKQEFFNELKLIIEFMKRVRQTSASATEGFQPSLTSQSLNTTTHHQLGGDNIHTSRQEDSRGRHITGNQSQYQNVAYSYSEARQITPTPKYHFTGTRATESSCSNVLQQSLTSGPRPPRTENKSNLANVGILPNFNGQNTLAQEDASQLPPLSWMDSLQRQMESSTNSRMTHLTSDPTPILSQFIRQQDNYQIMQPQMTIPHQFQSPYLSSSSALESNAGVSPKNSIEWQDQAYTQLILVREKYMADLTRAYQGIQTLQLQLAEFLSQEIEFTNGGMFETKVQMIDGMIDAAHGTEGVILQFTYIPVPDLDAPFMLPDVVLQVIVRSDYPYSSPVIVPSNPQPRSGDEHAKAIWDKTFQKFDRALRTLQQPVSVGQMANAWDSSAREACHEYTETLGGGSFGS